MELWLSRSSIIFGTFVMRRGGKTKSGGRKLAGIIVQVRSSNKQ